MPDSYHVPALALTLLLLPAFGYLYRRFRDVRTLLWFLGFLFAAVRMILVYKLGWWDFTDVTAHPWLATLGQSAIQISSALFLGSLSPLSFRMGRLNVLYVIPYTLPLLVYSFLCYTVFHGASPTGWMLLVPASLGLASLLVAFFWAKSSGALPTWLLLALCVVLGGLIYWVFVAFADRWPLTLMECGSHLMTALLVFYAFRRISPGVGLTTLGFAAWSLTIFKMLPAIAANPTLNLDLTRCMVMGKVVAAVGMILLALEDELAVNKAARDREQRARRELEAYTHLVLSARRVEEFDRQGADICKAVAQNSRFAQAALLLESAGRYRLAGAAGFDGAVTSALGALAGRIPTGDFLTLGSASSAVDRGQTLNLKLDRWLTPGGDLQRLHFTAALAVPMSSGDITQGALLLAGMRNPAQPLHADDLLPVETFAARVQAARSQTTMLEKLIDSEKFVGLGHLAGNVTQQLNNPLTVILGYASLLEETATLDPQERKGLESILAEARRMRATLESLSRVARPQNEQMSAVSVTELLTDMEELHRAEFLQRSIELRVNISPSLPRVMSHAHQLRQAVLHCLHFALEAADSQHPDRANAPPEARSVRLEATSEGNVVQILVAHNGPGFLHPEQAFDPFVPAQSKGEIAGLGLSLCASILRSHNGRASAINLEPRGAAILIELQAA
jgi:signal transduction histidine kinase